MFGRRWPVMLLMLVGLIVSIVRWKRHPRVSLLAVAGILLYITQWLIFGTAFYQMPTLHDRGFSYQSLIYIYLLVEICQDFVYSGVIVLLISAALAQRNQLVLTNPPNPI
jgi:hypothetical protein